MKWFYRASTCIVGNEEYGVFETPDEDEHMAYDIGWDYAYDNACSYYSIIDENDSPDYEMNGDCYMEQFIFYEDVYVHVVKYEPLLHNMYL